MSDLELLRDLFAMATIAGIHAHGDSEELSVDVIAEYAYIQADAALVARSGPKNDPQ